jgi:uncharacterized repeat protein (TIGR03803 family)
VFAVNTDGTGLTNLHVFTATSGNAGFNAHGTNGDGAYPNAALVISGNTLYGTTEGGSQSGNGNVFAVNTDGTGFTVLYAFTAASGSFLTNSDGRSPTCSLVLSGDTLYGTASGGTSGAGTVFALNINSMVFTVLHTFASFSSSLTNSDGITPAGGLILSGGILYGTAGSGGASGGGTVFALSTNGTGFTNLHSFDYTNGFSPSTPLILSGNTLYGTTYRGGLGGTGSGTVFALNTDGNGFTNLHDFAVGNGDANSDGALPQGALLLSAGILYGTTLYGGPDGDGTVFAVYTNGTGFSDLYDFTGYSASLPCAALILSDNTLYGTATGGGGYGSVFALSLPPALNSAPVITWSTPPVIYGTDLSSILNATANVPGTFDYSPTNDTVLSEGAHPITLIFTPADTLYYSSVTDTVTQVVLPVPVFTTLHSFAELSTNAPYGNGDGAQPQSGLILSGNTLYGTAEDGGTNGSGTVFALSTNGTGFTNVYSFTGGSDGAAPLGGLILSGNTLYGTAEDGGTNGSGTVFALSTNGTGFTNQYEFAGGNDGGNPVAGLVLSGNTLYGTTEYGGTNGSGTVFALNANGTGFTNVYSFTDGSDGAYPKAGLVLSGGILYGTAEDGGTNGSGTVFAVNTNGTGFTILHDFTGGNDGTQPQVGLILSGSTLYGTASEGGAGGTGTVFALNTNGTGFTTLYSFTALVPNDSFGLPSVNSDGAYPEAGLVLSGNTLYGTTYDGGTNGTGAVFAVYTDGSGLTSLYSFTALVPNDSFGLPSTNSDGANPIGALVLSGNTLYGTAVLGGSSGLGTVFALSLSSPGVVRPLITWNPAPITYGTALSSGQLNADAGVPGTYAYSPTNGTVLNSGANTLSVIFTPTDTVDFTSATNAVSLDVSPALLTVTAASESRAVGLANPVFTGTITGVTNGDDITATYSCSATANSPAGNYLIVPSLVDPNDRQTNYIVNLVDGTLTVGPVTPIITWTSPAPIPYGTALSSNQLDATASVPGSFAYTPPNGTVLSAGTNTLSVVFTPTDTMDYASVTNTVSLVVSPAIGTIALYIQLVKNNVILTWNDPTSIFGLQAAPSLRGIFTNISSAASPYTNIITGTDQFFRLMAK